jgi:hypothetical protein
MAGAVSIAGASGAQAGKPEVMVPEESFDFGYTMQDAKISHIFWIKNTGDDTLFIQDVKPGCGCTKAPLKKTELPASDSTDVEVIFSTGHYSNRTTKSARILSNATNVAPSLMIMSHPLSSIDSLPLFSLNPPRLDLDETRTPDGNSGLKYEIKLMNKSSEPYSLRMVSEPAMTDVKITLPSGTISPGNEETITIALDGSISGEIFAKSFTFEASDSARTRFTFPIEKKMRWGPTPVSSAR